MRGGIFYVLIIGSSVAPIVYNMALIVIKNKYCSVYNKFISEI